MTTKIAVSLPDEQVAAARAAVAEGRAASVSAYVSEALAQRTANEELLALLAEDEAANPSTDEHRAWARRALGIDPPLPEERGTEPASSAPSTRSGSARSRTRRQASKATTGRFVTRAATTGRFTTRDTGNTSAAGSGQPGPE